MAVFISCFEKVKQHAMFTIRMSRSDCVIVHQLLASDDLTCRGYQNITLLKENIGLLKTHNLSVSDPRGLCSHYST